MKKKYIMIIGGLILCVLAIWVPAYVMHGMAERDWREAPLVFSGMLAFLVGIVAMIGGASDY